MPRRTKLWSDTSVARCCCGRFLFLLRVVLAACLFAAAAAAPAQISPGPLSRAHSFLGGATNCTVCHRLGAQASLKCLDCHTDIATRMSAGRGFHARVAPEETGNQKCASCHSEHNGADFSLIKWEPSQQQFDHARSGWVLTGKHAALSCNRCHTPANISASERPLIKMKDLSRTFLGLSTACSSCHADPHGGRLGLSCEQCHTSDDWKKVASFDHSRARFALTGAHARVACADCHKATAAGSAARWTGLAFGQCSDCHKDPHRGAFAQSCQSCHSTAAWKAVPASLLAVKFDHAKTPYPLLGKHAQLQCEQCHQRGDFKKAVAFQKCTDCHRDLHGGQFLKRADAGECSSCHTVDGFKPAKFGLAEHGKTAYPLLAKHADVACAKCHIPAGTATLYRVKFAQCTDCHRDPHAAQFAAAPHRNRCEDCHSVQGFRPSTFTLARHQQSAFPLRDSHLAVACDDCHRSMDPSATVKVARFRFSDRTCTACHDDPHRGQFRQRMLQTAADGNPKGCQACHSLTTWKDLSAFDHDSTAFRLVGSHRAVACADCHRPPNLEVTLAHADFRAAPHTCDACHKDPHAGQFASVAEKCASCHNTNKWQPSTFDHNARTRFPLEGVHKNVHCENCHKLKRVVDGTEVLFYKPTPTACADCHGSSVKSGAISSLRDEKFISVQQFLSRPSFFPQQILPRGF